MTSLKSVPIWSRIHDGNADGREAAARDGDARIDAGHEGLGGGREIECDRRRPQPGRASRFAAA